MIELLNMDCMDYLKGCEDNAFDLAICDPPYGININMNMGRKAGMPAIHEVKSWDNSGPPKEYFDELFRVSRFQIIWGGNYFPLPLTGSWIFWDKAVPDGVSFADGELAWTSGDKALKKVFIPYSGFQGSEGKIHPTQKPVKLYEWLLVNYAEPGRRILDTHLGSGSSAIAAHYFGCDFVGMEIDADYHAAAVKRFNAETAQLDIFG